MKAFPLQINIKLTPEHYMVLKKSDCFQLCIETTDGNTSDTIWCDMTTLK